MAMAQPKMTAQDKKWQAESDARALMDAQAIISDAARVKAAKPEIRKLASEQQKKANAAQTAARKLTGAKRSAKRPSAGGASKRKR
uniref:Uncharacterized protein n=1 Tax=viral metagenome TaxID=1070528 RepID=A0A6H1ZLN4_9ZZZZ